MWTGVALSGAALLAVSSVALLPMVREGVAVRTVRARFELERPAVVEAGERRAAYECGGMRVVLSDGRGADPAAGAATGSPEEGSSGRRLVTVQVGDTLLVTAVPVGVNEEAEGANRYWNRVVPFRWADRRTGEVACGVVYRLGPDTAAVRRAQERRPRTEPGLLMERVRGVRPAHLRGLRFRVIGWEPGGRVVTERNLAYTDWDGDPYGTLVANLLGGPIGIRNQSLSYWPTLLFPVAYPLGLGLLGALLLVGGLIARYRVGS